MRLPASLGRLWDRAFFPDESAVNLAATRVIVSLHALWVLLSRDVPAMSSLPTVFWDGTSAASRWRYLVFPGHAGIEYAVQAIAIVALAAAALGMRPRISCLVAGLTLYHLAGLETLFWTANPYQRGFTVSVPALLTLAASRCGDAFVFGKAGVAAPSPIYGWPLRLCQLYLAEVYLWSAWSKLDRVGIGWMEPDNLRRWFLLFSQQDQVQYSGSFFHWFGPWVASNWLLCLLAGMIGVGIDLVFILAVFFPPLRKWIVPKALLFHLAVVMSFNIFFNNIPQLLMFVNWPWLREWLGRRGARGSDARAPGLFPGGGEAPDGLTIVYDGECPFCSNYVRLVRLRASVGVMRLIDARDADAVARELWDMGVDLDQTMAVRFDGRWRVGGDAIATLAALSQPSGAWGALHRILFASARRSRAVYPFLRAARNASLAVMGRVRLAPPDRTGGTGDREGDGRQAVSAREA